MLMTTTSWSVRVTWNATGGQDLEEGLYAQPNNSVSLFQRSTCVLLAIVIYNISILRSIIRLFLFKFCFANKLTLKI